jgi:putative membrane protein
MREISQPVLESAAFTIPITSVLGAIAVIYWLGWHRLRRSRVRGIPPWRLAAFMGGLVAVWAAAASPLALLDHRLLTMHMVQHLLLMTVAPLLLLLGEPRFCLARGLPNALARPLYRWLDQMSIGRLGRILVNPRVCFLTAVAVLVLWHLPAIFDVAMRSQAWHRVEVGTFLISGILFWLPVTQPWTSAGTAPWWNPLYLFLATLPCDVLSAFLTFCDRVIYHCYSHGARPVHISALQDQQYAGALMWTCVTFAYSIPAVIVTAALVSQHDQNPLAGVRDSRLQFGDGWQLEPSHPSKVVSRHSSTGGFGAPGLIDTLGR